MPKIQRWRTDLTEEKEEKDSRKVKSAISLREKKSLAEVDKFRDLRSFLQRGADPIQNQAFHYRYYKLECFPHIAYISKLARNLKPEVEKVIQRSISERALSTDVIIKIMYAGEITKENLRLVSKRKGSKSQPINGPIWDESPIVCFENDKNKELAFKQKFLNYPYQQIFVKSTSSGGETFVKNENYITAGRDHVRQAITICLEDTLRCLLNKWKQEIESTVQTKPNLWLITEIENITKHLLSEVTTSGSQSFRCEHIVPQNVKDYLFSQDDVTSFGLWKNSRFRVCTRKSADQEKLKNNLTKLNRDFFYQYQLFFETTTFIERLTMKQGDCIARKKNDNIFEGTLGGFVQEQDDCEKVYGLTCNHLFPTVNCSAFAGDDLESVVGTCVFTTRECSSDFAAIKMNRIDKCDVKFSDEDRNQKIARVFNGNINDIGVVHKIGKITGPTTGSIVSPEYYNKLFDDDNREFLFLVGKSGEQAFSEQGDSGALVFAHPKDFEHTYVNVVGMVYGHYEKESERLDEDEHSSVGTNISTKTEEANEATGKTSISRSRQEHPADPDHISCCYRIHPALSLFQTTKQISVKFKEDLSSSSSSSSSSPSSSEDYS